MSFTFKNLDGKTITDTGGKMPITDMLGVPSITGGAAAPSRADSNSGNAYVTMNNPFSVAGAGGRASATAETSSSPIDTTTLLLLAVIAGIVLIGLK